MWLPKGLHSRVIGPMPMWPWTQGCLPASSGAVHLGRVVGQGGATAHPGSLDSAFACGKVAFTLAQASATATGKASLQARWLGLDTPSPVRCVTEQVECLPFGVTLSF